MKEFRKYKVIFLAGILVITGILLGTTTSKAALQANPTTHKNPVSKTGAAWITEIRKMETAGQSMGLTETLNGVDATSGDNNIDVHMMLPNEYEAIAVLSASGYGNSGKLQDEEDIQKRTTTGNSTGIHFTGDRWEWIAAYSASEITKYNYGKPSDISKLNAFNGWHNASHQYWMADHHENRPDRTWNTYLIGLNRYVLCRNIYLL